MRRIFNYTILNYTVLIFPEHQTCQSNCVPLPYLVLYFLTDKAFSRTKYHSKTERFPPTFIYFVLFTFLSSYTLDRNSKNRMNRSSKHTLKMHIIIPLLRLQFQKQTINVCWGRQHFLNNMHNIVPTCSLNYMYFVEFKHADTNFVSKF